MNSKYVMLEREKMQNSLIKTIEKHSQGEIIEKKSRFIANIYPINSKKEAETLILEIKNKYRDAKHNCFAFSVYEENQKYTKCSDDGEPSGTAGVPILNVIEKNNMSNILIVITRYFGGILLGTGGLVRAYSEATNVALKNAEIIEMDLGLSAFFEVNYGDLNKIKYYFEQKQIEIINQDFKDSVKIFVNLTDEKYFEIIENKGNFNFAILSFGKIEKKYVKKLDNY